MSTEISYIINISGNAAAVVNNITGGVDKMNTSVRQSAGLFQNLTSKIEPTPKSRQIYFG